MIQAGQYGIACAVVGASMIVGFSGEVARAVGLHGWGKQGALVTDVVMTIVGLLLISVGVFALTVSIRAGIGISVTGVWVRTMLGRTTRIDWPDVDRFDISKAAGLQGTSCIAVLHRRNAQPQSARAEGSSANARRPLTSAICQGTR